MYFEAHKIKKIWEDFTLDFSFEAEENSLTCLTGPSGKGKTTILRIIAGLEKSDSPETKILLDGKDITQIPVGKRNVGMMFQSAALFGNLNVQDNIAYGLVSGGMNRKTAREKASEALKKINMKGFEKRNVNTLSGGQCQRVALARTLICRPKLILLDEPLSALDEDLRFSMLEEIRNLVKSSNTTAIMVTHNPEEAKIFSDKIIKLS